MNPFDSPFEQLFAKKSSLIKPGLERMRAVLPFLGQLIGSESEFILAKPTVLVGGTNGKGSTSAYLWQLLAGAGIRTGLFTSPHLVHFRERFFVEDQANDQELIELWAKMEAACPREVSRDLSFFEWSTLLAMGLFDLKQTAIDIYEVGLGGRLDSTNILQPTLSIIASIGFDHQEYLGADITSITNEKLGISRPGRPLFVGELAYPEAELAITAHCRRQAIPLFRYGQDFGLDDSGIWIKLSKLPPRNQPSPAGLKFMPPFLQRNYALACASYYWLEQNVVAESDRSHHLDVTPPSLRGRFQRVQLHKGDHHCKAVIDICHNVDGVRAFKEGLQALYPKTQVFPGLVSILGDKDINQMLDNLASFISPLVLFKIDHPRGFSVNQLDARHQNLPVYDSLSHGLDELMKRVASEEAPLVICGSVMAVGQIFDQDEIAVKNHQPSSRT